MDGGAQMAPALDCLAELDGQATEPDGGDGGVVSSPPAEVQVAASLEGLAAMLGQRAEDAGRPAVEGVPTIEAASPVWAQEPPGLDAFEPESHGAAPTGRLTVPTVAAAEGTSAVVVGQAAPGPDGLDGVDAQGWAFAGRRAVAAEGAAFPPPRESQAALELEGLAAVDLQAAAPVGSAALAAAGAAARALTSPAPASNEPAREITSVSHRNARLNPLRRIVCPLVVRFAASTRRMSPSQPTVKCGLDTAVGDRCPPTGPIKYGRERTREPVQIPIWPRSGGNGAIATSSGAPRPSASLSATERDGPLDGRAATT